LGSRNGATLNLPMPEGCRKIKEPREKTEGGTWAEKSCRQADKEDLVMQKVGVGRVTGGGEEGRQDDFLPMETGKAGSAR